MRVLLSARPSALLAFASFALVLPPSSLHAGQAAPAANAAVTVTDIGTSFTLDNGIVKATIRKGSGSMASLIYRGVETMGGNGGYWEQTPQDAPQLTNTITIDPASNGGARAEISIKGVTGGQTMLGRGTPWPHSGQALKLAACR